MGQNYTLKVVQRRNEWESKYGPMVDYAVTVEGDSLGWIKFTQKPETTPPQPGQNVFGTILQEKTKQGNPYRKFKKENPSYQQGSNGSGASSGIDQQKIDYIVLMLEELTDRRPPQGSEPREPNVEPHDDPFEGLI